MLHIRYVICFVDLCADIWSTKISNQFIYGHCTNFPCIYKLLTLCTCSLMFAYTNVFSHFNTNTLVLLFRCVQTSMYLYNFSTVTRQTDNQQTIVICISGHTSDYPDRNWLASNTIAFIIMCNFSNRGLCCCDYGYFIC